jgi:hypothetical protein
MTKQALALVPDATATDQSVALSPGRRSLQTNLRDREAITAEGEAARRAQSRAASLLDGPERFRQQITALEAERARVVHEWSTSGADERPQLPHEAKLTELRAELAEAEQLAAAARAAMPDLQARLERNVQASIGCTKEMLESVASVTEEEMVSLIADLVERERECATQRAKLSAAIGELRLMALRRQVPEAEFAASRLQRAIPGHSTYTDAYLNSFRPKVQRFFEALMRNEAAKLNFEEESSG